jgi:hypothetical protein
MHIVRWSGQKPEQSGARFSTLFQQLGGAHAAIWFATLSQQPAGMQDPVFCGQLPAHCTTAASAILARSACPWPAVAVPPMVSHAAASTNRPAIM